MAYSVLPASGRAAVLWCPPDPPPLSGLIHDEVRSRLTWILWPARIGSIRPASLIGHWRSLPIACRPMLRALAGTVCMAGRSERGGACRVRAPCPQCDLSDAASAMPANRRKAGNSAACRFWTDQNPDTVRTFNPDHSAMVARRLNFRLFLRGWWWALKGSNLRPAD